MGRQKEATQYRADGRQSPGRIPFACLEQPGFVRMEHQTAPFQNDAVWQKARMALGTRTTDGFQKHSAFLTDDVSARWNNAFTSSGRNGSGGK